MAKAKKQSAFISLPFTSPVIDPENIITTEILAERLHVDVPWVYEKLRKGRANPLPVFRIGRYLRFDWKAVCAWLQATSNKPEAAR